MTDREFVDAIFERLDKVGWITGRIGTKEGPNCILGAAGFVAHPDLAVDVEGINPIAIGDRLLLEKEYEEVPGMARLNDIIEPGSVVAVININDDSRSLEEVRKRVYEILENK